MLQTLLQQTDNKTKSIYMTLSSNDRYLAIKKTSDLLLFSEDFYYDIWDLQEKKLLITVLGSIYRNEQFSQDNIYFCQQVRQNQIPQIQLINLLTLKQTYIELILDEMVVIEEFCFQYQGKSILINDIKQDKIIFWEQDIVTYLYHRIEDIRQINQTKIIIYSTQQLLLFDLKKLTILESIILKDPISHKNLNVMNFSFSYCLYFKKNYVVYQAKKIIRKFIYQNNDYEHFYQRQSIVYYIQNQYNLIQVKMIDLFSLSQNSITYDCYKNNEIFFKIPNMIATNKFILILEGIKGSYKIFLQYQSI